MHQVNTESPTVQPAKMATLSELLQDKSEYAHNSLDDETHGKSNEKETLDDIINYITSIHHEPTKPSDVSTERYLDKHTETSTTAAPSKLLNFKRETTPVPDISNSSTFLRKTGENFLANTFIIYLTIMYSSEFT